jgi:hypothetical protein
MPHRIWFILSEVMLHFILGNVGWCQSNGPLRLHPENQRYFADASGKAILLTGSHTWNDLIDMGPTDPPDALDFDEYLVWLKGHGHNFIRGWTWEPTTWDTTQMKNVEWRNGSHHVAPQPWARIGPKLALDGKPQFDLQNHNPAYLRRIRERLAKARKAGIYVSVMLFEGYGVQFQRDAWPHHPMNPANNIQGIDGDKNADGKGIEVHQLLDMRVLEVQESYLRWLISGLNDFDNVLYEVSNETHPDSTDWQYHVIRYVKQIESKLPYQHPIGMTFQNRRGKNQSLYDSPADWISPNSEGGFRDDPPDARGQKVILSDTDHLWGIGGEAIWVWKTFTRGLNPIFMDTYEGKVLGKVRPVDDGPRRAMGQVLTLSSQINLARTVPHPELCSTGYCLAEPGIAYVVFAPDGGQIEIDLQAVSGLFTAEWLDVTTGQVIPSKPVTGGSTHLVRAEFGGAAVYTLRRSPP